MASKGFFMGMMNETLEHNGTQWDGLGTPPEEQTVYSTPTTQATDKKTRNKNFPGTNKRRGAFWTRVHNFYHFEKEITVLRTPNSLSHCCTHIQESVNKFCGCFVAIDGRNRSGNTFETQTYGCLHFIQGRRQRAQVFSVVALLEYFATLTKMA